MGTKNNPAPNDCYANALPDEPMFTLLARDTSAPELVRNWAEQRDGEVAMGKRPQSDKALVVEAYDCADNMERWREENHGAWRR